MQELIKLGVRLRRHLDTSEHASDVAALAAVVEERNVPAGVNPGQEALQRTGALGETEAEEAFIGHGGTPADEVARMRLGQLIVAHILGWHTCLIERLQDAADLELTQVGVGLERLCARHDRVRFTRRHRAIEEEGCENMRLGRAAVAVGKLGHVAWMEKLVQAEKAAGAVGDRHRHNHLALLTELGTLRNKAQPVKVHVRTADHGHETAACSVAALRRNVPLHTSHGESAGRLCDRTRVFKHILDGGTDLVVRHSHDAVDQRAAQTQRLIAHDSHSCAIAE